MGSLAMLHRFFLFFLFPEVWTLECPTGYADDGIGNCQTGKLPAQTQLEAYSRCAADNGYILNVQNAFENTNVDSLTDNSFVWLGLTCTSTFPTSCLWDNGVVINSTTYTNFAPNHPNANIGACVYYSPSNKQWYSASCGVAYSYICKMTPGINVPSCPPGSYYFRKRCYYSPDDTNLSNTRTRCNDSCADLASIHNSGENSMVRDVAHLSHPSPPYTFIGLSCASGECDWNDGTQYDYNGFGHRDESLGSCVLMASTSSGTIVPGGQWLSVDCQEPNIAVCKRDLDCPWPIDMPETCPKTQYLKGSGEIKSPGYPYGTLKNHCQFVITQAAGYGVTLLFTELSLDLNSTIKIYNDELDVTPCATLTAETQANRTTFYSTANIFIVAFDTPGSVDIASRWRLKYDMYRLGANNCGGVYNITPAMVVSSKENLNCTYVFKSGEQRTCLRFINYGLQSLSDHIAIYDGEISSENNIGYLSYINDSVSPPLLVTLCTTNTNYMNLVPIRNSGLSYEMFTVMIGDSPESMGFNSCSGGNTFQGVVTTYILPHYNWIQHLQQNVVNTYIDRFEAAPGMRVHASFAYISFPYPHNFIILDGDHHSQVAFAIGQPTRMTYVSSEQYISVVTIFRPAAPSIGTIGYGANFSSPCDAAVFTAPGTITGPTDQTCYKLKVGSARTCLRFTKYNVKPGDYISIMDGEIGPQNNIGYLSHNNGSDSPQMLVTLCTSNTNYMYLAAVIHSGVSYEMFTIKFGDSPESMGFNSTSSGNITFPGWAGNYPCPINVAQSGKPVQNNIYNDRYDAPSGLRVYVQFAYMNFPDPNDIIILDGDYNSQVALAIGAPARNVYQSTGQYLTCATIFRQDTPANVTLGFKGAFTPVCTNVYTTPGTITGPSDDRSCYKLQIGRMRTCLRFTSYKVKLGDYVAIYDGEVVPQNNIAYITHSNVSLSPFEQVVLCTSNTNYMNLVTTLNSGQSYEMFTIKYADSYETLQIDYTFQPAIRSISRNVPVIDFWQDNALANVLNFTINDRWIAPNGERVRASFALMVFPYPDNIVILDGNFDAPVALAYGAPTRMIYQSSQKFLTVTTIFHEAVHLNHAIGYSGNFTAVM